MPTYNPAAPWTVGATVTDEFGNEFEATGPNSLKKPAWVPPALPEATDCCTYLLESTANLVDGSPTTIVGAPTVKTNGDTAVQCHPNGLSTWTCVNGAWQLSWVKIFPEATDPVDPIIPAEVQISDDEPDKEAGIRVWFNCNDGCVYFCQPDGMWLSPKGCPQPAPAGALTNDCVASDDEYAAANDGCDPDEGMPIGKNSEGKLVSQPPLPCGLQNAALAAVQVVGAALTPLAAEPSIIFDNLCVTHTNDSCWPMIARGLFRSNFSVSHAAGARNYWAIGASGTASGSGTNSWSGISVVRKTTCNSNNCPERESIPVIEISTGTMQPGQDLTICQSVTLQAVNYTENALNALTVGANTVSMMSWGCQTIIPTSNTVANVEV